MADTLYNSMYNPDVLSCIANLSNDEVFTPPEVANAVLDLLPQELFQNPDSTFLDPACKSGVFLREIAKRLIDGLEDVFPSIEERAAHIFQKQLFGIAITELTSHLSRRSVYCSKTANGNYSVAQMDTVDGNIRYKIIQHRFQNGKCVYCGASEAEYGSDKHIETHAYEMIHTIHPEEVFNMKFDVIISNPPYQLSDGGSAGGAIPIYHKFVQQAKKLNPRYLSMIIPARWYAGGRGLDEFRTEMLSDDSISKMVDYPKSRDCFQGVDIAGGVCYFLKEKDYEGSCEYVSIINDVPSKRTRVLNEFSIFIRDNMGIDIIHKVKSKSKSFMDSIVEPVSPFGLRSFTRGKEKKFKGALTLFSSAGKSYITKDEVKKGHDLIKKYKVGIGYLNPDRAGVNNAADGKSSVTTKIMIYYPGEVITETYILVGCFDTLDEANSCASYLQTKLVRFLVLQTLSSMHITKVSFQFVPLVSFKKQWNDKKVSKQFDLSQEEIDYIDETIRPISIIEREDIDD